MEGERCFCMMYLRAIRIGRWKYEAVPVPLMLRDVVTYHRKNDGVKCFELSVGLRTVFYSS